jgi:hypothetical protein
MKTICAFGALVAVAAAISVVSGLAGVPMDASVPLALAATVQASYSERMRAAVAGMIANMTDYDSVTRNVETEAGIGFGLAVSRGTDPRGAIIGGTLAGFQGATILDRTLEPTSPPTDRLYPQYAEAGVLRRGEIWVLPGEAVEAGADVHFDAATGRFLAAGGQGPIVGAQWMTSGDDATLAIVYLGGGAQT